MGMFKRWRKARDQREAEQLPAGGPTASTSSRRSFRKAVRRGASKTRNQH